ncbi:MIF4G-like, type 3 [Dillenia turbinata]|uniref:MIF4G-like, type 3 n=1 Tax=Dillenia turbinata TaxID=194707 RepID=A0AAN8VTS9_9MAGN
MTQFVPQSVSVSLPLLLRKTTFVLRHKPNGVLGTCLSLLEGDAQTHICREKSGGAETEIGCSFLTNVILASLLNSVESSMNLKIKEYCFIELQLLQFSVMVWGCLVASKRRKMDHHEDESRVGGEHNGKQDDEEALTRLGEFKKSMEAKMALRQSNLNPERPDSAFLRTLDSSIKRNTAVIKKLKLINEEQREGLMDELRSVNLSKFVSEAVTAICDAKLRTSDIQAAVQICSLLHQRYKDFSPSLIQGLLKVFFPGKSGDDLDSDRNSKAMKKRSTMKLLLELYFVGISEDISIFINIIKDLTGVEHLKDRDTTQTNLSLLASFARQGRIFLGLPQSGQDMDEEFFRGLNIISDQKKIFRKAFHTYYDAVAELLQSEHMALRQMEHENSKILNAKGELSEDSISSYERLRKSYDHLFRGVTSLAEALDMQPPVMPEDGLATRVTSGEDASSPAAGKETSSIEAMWDDEDTRAFYECLPDLRAFVPAVLLGEAEPKVNEQSTKTQEQPPDAAAEADQGPPAAPDNTEVAADAGSTQEGKSSEKGKEKEDKDREKMKDPDKERGKEKDADRKGEIEKEKLKGLEGTNLDGLLQRLPGCVSRDLIDQLTVEFCYLNSKANRKRLVRALFNVPRTSLELLPYYSRMVATLSTCMKDVTSMLLQLLEEEFNFLINKKDQMNIETKIRNIRFIGELCKFKIAPAGLVFSCLKACLDDFSHHNIDVACNLLETCGRFLYRSPETTIRMANMLEILMRLKNVKNLDPRHSTLVENAYYLCKPPERSARVSKVRPPLHQYIRKLLFSDLEKNSIEHVLRQLRKLPWSECQSYLVKCFLKVHRGKYGQINLIASLTAGLSRYHDEFAVAVVDEVLEEIRVGLELNEYGMQQRRIAHMRFLGELYNYEHVDSSVVFDTLYLLLVFGHGTAEQDELDPPDDFFRIRLVITLLETCGHYFDRGSSKRKLDRYLIHFQRYILCKGVLPLDIEFDLQDLFAELRPNMTRYMTLEEVNAALLELEEHERNTSSDKTGTEKHSDVEKRPSRTSSNVISANGKGLANGIEENGEAHEDIEESDTDLSGLSDPSVESEDDDDDSEDDDEDDGGGPPSDEDEVHVRSKMAEVDPQEESLDSRKLELRARPTLNMMIPMNVFEGSIKDHHGRTFEGESGDETLDDESGENKEVKVKVLVKRGNKQQTKQMLIPRDCSLVQSTKQKEAAELEEKQDIKRLVLEYNDREEEELNGMGTQTMGWMPSGGSRIASRGGTWEGSSGRGSGTRHRHHHYSGSGGYYSRRR